MVKENKLTQTYINISWSEKMCRLVSSCFFWNAHSTEQPSRGCSVLVLISQLSEWSNADSILLRDTTYWCRIKKPKSYPHDEYAGNNYDCNIIITRLLLSVWNEINLFKRGFQTFIPFGIKSNLNITICSRQAINYHHSFTIIITVVN